MGAILGAVSPATSTVTPLTPYQRRLLLFLGGATFFDGFDLFALSQLLPALRREFALSPQGEGLLVAIINIGTLLSYFIVRQADRAGRRAMLLLSLTGYPLASLATALAPTLELVAFGQLVARVFLVAGWALAMIYAAEEFPAERRGLAIGLVQASSSLGSVACAGMVPLLYRLPLGWRGVFLFGVLPIILLAFAGRLRETERFGAEAAKRSRAPQSRGRRFGLIWTTRYRRLLLEVALIWALTYVCTQTAITFWKEFAVSERGLSEEAVGRTLALAAVLAVPLVFGVGKVLDRLGRRPGAALAFGSMIVGVLAAYGLHDRWALLGGLALGIFGINSVLPVLNTYTTELFPTELRSDAFAWANNLLGRTTYVVAPWLVGMAAGSMGWSRAVSLTTLCALLALILILWLLPETSGQELEHTAEMAWTAQAPPVPPAIPVTPERPMGGEGESP